jgi:hypothetical protein
VVVSRATTPDAHGPTVTISALRVDGRRSVMPAGRGANSLKDPELYEKLRDDGASKEKAARVSNAAARDGRKKVGQRGGKSGDYDDWTVQDLRSRAKELGLTGYSTLRKAELISRLRSH